LARVIVLDASALIAQLDRTDIHHQHARQLLLDSLDQPLGASMITLAEALVAPAQAGRLDEAHTALRELAVRAIALDANAAPTLAVLRAETGLRMPDCCVLYAAAVTGAETIATFDERLARVARARGLNTP
jgi:predicted nucleic acid-binding protein